MRVLFLTNTPPGGPSARYRVYQFIPCLDRHGIKASCHSALTPFIYRRCQPSGGGRSKIIYFGLSALSRLLALFRLAFYDVVYVQKIVLPHVYPFPELMLCKLGRLLGKRVIFDYDDAIFTVSEVRKKTWFERFACPDRLPKVLAQCDCVVAGNNHLADFARGYCKNVEVLPTCVELTRYPARPWNKCSDPVVIGWIGTPSTVPYLDLIAPALRRVAEKRAIVLRIVGGKEYYCPGVKVECLPWTLAGEVELIKSFDIGVMPLADDAWSRGKCGLKLLQYMAAGVPAVASPVGVNSEIIQDGVNGYLAADTAGWVEALERIIANPAAHADMVKKARETVKQAYAVESNHPKMARILKGNGYRRTSGSGK